MIKIFETIDCCRLCNSTDIQDVLDLGSQPPANSLYKIDEEKPPCIPLRLLFCIECLAVQLGESVDPEYLFSQYVWVTGTSKTAEKYSLDFAKNAISHSHQEHPTVLEIASNDGTFLNRFLEAGCNVQGVDPAQNIAEDATSQGIPTMAEFFTVELAQRLVEEQGQRDIVFARNVLPHVKAIHSVVDGIGTLLKDDGVGIIEFHDAGLILEELHYDSIYHEHLFLLSLHTISTLLGRYNLHVFDIMKSPISGGSWVISFSHNVRVKSQALLDAEKREDDAGTNTLDKWQEFADKSTAHAAELKQIVEAHDGKMLAYGASARSSTLLNFCGLNNDHISGIIDKNPMKHDLMTPGSNIPIISYEKGIEAIQNVDKILLLAWNFEDEIVRDLRANGFSGEFIVPLPNEVRIV